VLGAALLAPSLHYPFGRDQSVFAYVAQTMQHGGLPYRDVWDLKPPGIYAVYRAILALFGTSMTAVRAADLICACATALALFGLGRRFGGPVAAASAAVWYAAAYFRMEFWAMAQAESFAAMPVVAALACWWRGWERHSPVLFLVAGLLGGIGAALKFTMVLPLAVPILLTLATRPRVAVERSSAKQWLLAALLTAVGVALPLIASILWMRGAGCWENYLAIQRGFVSGYTRLYLSSLPRRGLRHTLEFALRYAFLLLLAVAGLRYLHRARIAGTPAVDPSRDREGAVPGLPVERSSPDREPLPHGLGSDPAIDAAPVVSTIRPLPFLLGWLLAAVIEVWAQGKFFRYHWIAALPPLCLLAGVGAAWLAAWPRERRRWVPVSALALALPALWSLVANGPEYVAAAGRALQRVPERVYLARFGRPEGGDFSFLGDVMAAQYVRAARAPERGVFIWGFEPLVYLLSGTSPPTRFIFAVPLVAPWAPAAWREELMRDLRAHPPQIILVVSHDVYPWATGLRADSAALLKQFPALNSFVQQHYQFQQVIEDFIVYRKRGR
jgi:4-amino-4-deoxy-L-arabinose transferase-like glycosyltransferase